MKNPTYNKDYYSNIQLYRLVFIIPICLYHLGTIKILHHGYLAVEFFFIISGFMIYQSIDKKIRPKEFLVQRYKKLYPEYIFALIIYFEYLIINNLINFDFYKIKEIFLKLIPEIFLLQDLGIWGGGNNYPLWYLAILVWGGFFLYCLLFKYEYFTVHIFSPLIIILYYSYNFKVQPSIELWNVSIFISNPLLRGLADMCIGVLLFKLWNFIKNNNYILKYGFILKIIGLIGIIICFTSQTYLDKYVLLFYPILIIGILSSKMQSKFINNLGKYTYPIYLNHAFIIGLVKQYLGEKLLSSNLFYTILTLFLLMIYSFLTHWGIGIFKEKS